MTHIETCIRHDCHEIATHTTVNGAFCDAHPAQLEAERTNYTPEQIEIYQQGVCDALHYLSEWIEEHRHDRPVITPLVLERIETVLARRQAR